MELIVKVAGLKEIEEALTTAGPRLARSALRKGLDAGADVFLQRARSLCPVMQTPTPARTPGELRDAITEVTTASSKTQSGRGRVGLKYGKRKGTEDPGVYGLFVEFGTHKMAAKPYMRPAYDSAKETAQNVFTAEMRAGVAKLGTK